MSVGFVMLVHADLDRAADVALHLAGSGAPVVVHADRALPTPAFERFRAQLSGHPGLQVCDARRRCEWGGWQIVEATIEATQVLLERFPMVERVFLASGSCLPLRPVPELAAYLDAHPGVDFIESVAVSQTGWSRGGFERERFELRFPFSFRRQRALFDRCVRLQKRLRLRHEPPDSLVPHLGSQWWCLTRRTLEAILADPRRKEFDRFFRRTWIPDESYFQSLVRRHAERIESRSLTFSKFDHWGRPHLLYDDHEPLLRQSGCFMARKVWPGAKGLYREFLGPARPAPEAAGPEPAAIAQAFEAAAQRRRNGRPGLYMQGRFPLRNVENRRSHSPYSVFWGLDALFADFDDWLRRQTGATVHGHLFAPARAEFEGGHPVAAGGLSDSAALRDSNPCGFLTNLLWNAGGARQCFLHGPDDTEFVLDFMAGDPNAQITVVSGAWALAMCRAGGCDTDAAARLHRAESRALETLNAGWTRARIRTFTLAEFLAAPVANLRAVVAEIAPETANRPAAAPKLVALDGLPELLAALRNAGLNLPLVGHLPEPAPFSPILPETQTPRLAK